MKWGNFVMPIILQLAAKYQGIGMDHNPATFQLYYRLCWFSCLRFQKRQIPERDFRCIRSGNYIYIHPIKCVDADQVQLIVWTRLEANHMYGMEHRKKRFAERQT
jgi:hypothetical protein